MFRTCGRDDVQGATVGAYIIKNNKTAKIAVLHDKSPYGKGVADETVKALAKGGIKPAMYEAYNDTDKDFTALINKMKQAKIDMIVLGGYHTAAAMLVKQSREQGFGAQLVGFDALEDPEFGKLGGAATNGVLMSFPPKAEDFPFNAALVKKFKDSGYDPTGYTLFTYAAVKVWADAANKAKSTDAAAIAKVLRSGTFQSAVGTAHLRREGRHQGPGLRHLYLEGRQVDADRQEVSDATGRREGPAHAGPFSLPSCRLGACRLRQERHCSGGGWQSRRARRPRHRQFRRVEQHGALHAQGPRHLQRARASFRAARSRHADVLSRRSASNERPSTR